MNMQLKVKFLSAIIGVLSVVLIGSVYYMWSLNQKVESLGIEREIQLKGTHQSNSNLMAPDVLNPLDPFSSQVDPWFSQWNPSAQFEEMQKRMEAMMNGSTLGRFPGGTLFNNGFSGLSSSSPSIDIDETGPDYEIRVTVPNGQEIELNTDLKGDRLTISGSVKTESQSELNGLFGRQSSMSRFSRSIAFSEPIDEGGMTIESKSDDKIVIRIPKVS